MMKQLTVGVLGMMLCLFAASPAASQEDPAASQQDPAATAIPVVPVEDALSGDEVRKLYEGNTELGEGRKGELDTGRRWTAFYDADGTVRKREANKATVKRGTWFVDSEGRNCFQYEGKEEPKCDLLVREGDHYLRVREGQVRGQVQIQEGNPSKL
jgi:hypothetical protein